MGNDGSGIPLQMFINLSMLAFTLSSMCIDPTGPALGSVVVTKTALNHQVVQFVLGIHFQGHSAGPCPYFFRAMRCTTARDPIALKGTSSKVDIQSWLRPVTYYSEMSADSK